MTDGRTRFADDQTLKDLAAVTLERDEWRQACLGHGEKAEAAERERDQLRAKLAEYEKLVMNAYNEGFAQGMREHTSSRGGIPWSDSAIRSRMGGENARQSCDGPSSTAYDESGYAKEAST